MLLGRKAYHEDARFTGPIVENRLQGGRALAKATTNRVGLYVALCFAFVLLIVLVGVTAGAENPRFLYLSVLFLLCSSPIVYSGQINGPYSILLAFLPFYFFCYGIVDVLSLVPDSGIAPVTGTKDALSPGEVAILLGALLLIVGYAAAVRLFSRTQTAEIEIKDWPPKFAIIFGLVLWAAGYVATWVMQTQWDEQVALGLSFNTWTATALVVGRMIEPVGLMLLAYHFVLSRSPRVLILLVGAIGAEFVLGFVGDSKELSLRGALIVIMTKYLIDGDAPKKWLIATGLMVAMTFGVFQAYRLEVLHVRQQTRTAAAEDIKGNLDTALNSKTLSSGLLASGFNGFVARTSLKQTMEIVANKVGTKVAYQDGYTIGLFFNAFIPRILWPTKPDSSVGQLFNRQFEISDDRDTFISATHLAELYWNFGWTGIVVGMFVIGFLLGTVGSCFALDRKKSVTRLFVLITTVYLVCLRFEGGIALQYTLWMRSLAMIFLLHLLFAKQAVGVPDRATQVSAKSPGKSSNAHTGVLTGGQILARMRAYRP